MNSKTKVGLEILQIALVLGVLGDLLLRQTPWGLNVFIFNLAFALGLLILLRRHAPHRLTGQTFALLGALVFFASMFVLRDAIELRVADTFAIITILGVLFLPTLKITARIAGVLQYAVGIAWAGLNSAFAPVALVGLDIKWSGLSQSGWQKHALSVTRGLLIALPLIFVFGALFVAADAVYEGWVRRVFNVDFEEIFGHLALFGVFAWLTAGYLRGTLYSGAAAAAEAVAGSIVEPEQKTESPMAAVRSESGEQPIVLPDNRTVVEHINSPEQAGAQTDTPPSQDGSASETAGTTNENTGKSWSWANIDNSIVPGFTLGAVEISVILGLVNLLFLSFVIIQLPYLFGGMEHVQATVDLKLSEYARRGFGELVVVSGLVLPVLLISHWLIRNEDRNAARLYKMLAGLQIGLLFVIMASAAQRLFLLTGPLGYGLTTVRLYPMILMTWFGIIFIWFGLTVLRGARRDFAWGALWLAIFALAGTHFLNPDKFIVETNLSLMRQGRDFDALYNSRLSDDALPTLLEALPELDADDQERAFRSLSDRFCEMREEHDLRSWNLSRRNATEALGPYAEILSANSSRCGK